MFSKLENDTFINKIKKKLIPHIQKNNIQLSNFDMIILEKLLNADFSITLEEYIELNKKIEYIDGAERLIPEKSLFSKNTMTQEKANFLLDLAKTGKI